MEEDKLEITKNAEETETNESPISLARRAMDFNDVSPEADAFVETPVDNKTDSVEQVIVEPPVVGEAVTIPTEESEEKIASEVASEPPIEEKVEA